MTITVSQALGPLSTEYGSVHKADPGSPLGKALAELPDWCRARDQLAALPPWSGGAAPGLGDGEAAVDAVLEQALTEGRSLTDPALQTAAAQAHAQGQGRLLLTQALNRRRERLASELDTVVASNRDWLLADLNGQLQTLLTEAREVLAVLGGIRDAEAAVDADLLAELRQWRGMVSRYASLRAAQSVVMGRLDSYGRSPRQRLHAHIAEPAKADPDYLARAVGLKVRDGADTRPARPASWPEDWTSAEALEWQTQHPEGGPWIPTAAQLDAAEAGLERERARLAQEFARVPAHQRALDAVHRAGVSA